MTRYSHPAKRYSPSLIPTGKIEITILASPVLIVQPGETPSPGVITTTFLAPRHIHRNSDTFPTSCRKPNETFSSTGDRSVALPKSPSSTNGAKLPSTIGQFAWATHATKSPPHPTIQADYRTTCASSPSRNGSKKCKRKRLNMSLLIWVNARRHGRMTRLKNAVSIPDPVSLLVPIAHRFSPILSKRYMEGAF